MCLCLLFQAFQCVGQADLDSGTARVSELFIETKALPVFLVISQELFLLVGLHNVLDIFDTVVELPDRITHLIYEVGVRPLLELLVRSLDLSLDLLAELFKNFDLLVPLCADLLELFIVVFCRCQISNCVELSLKLLMELCQPVFDDRQLLDGDVFVARNGYQTVLVHSL